MYLEKAFAYLNLHIVCYVSVQHLLCLQKMMFANSDLPGTTLLTPVPVYAEKVTIPSVLVMILAENNKTFLAMASCLIDSSAVPYSIDSMGCSTAWYRISKKLEVNGCLPALTDD